MDRRGPGVHGARRRGASAPVTRLAETNRLDVAQDELAILIAPAEVRDDAVARLLRLLTEISPSRRATDEVLEGAADLVYMTGTSASRSVSRSSAPWCMTSLQFTCSKVQKRKKRKKRLVWRPLLVVVQLIHQQGRAPQAASQYGP